MTEQKKSSALITTIGWICMPFYLMFKYLGFSLLVISACMLYNYYMYGNLILNIGELLLVFTYIEITAIGRSISNQNTMQNAYNQVFTNFMALVVSKDKDLQVEAEKTKTK